MENKKLNIWKSIFRICLFILIPLLIAAVFTAYGLELFTGGGYGPNFSFIKNPVISGTDGEIFTKYTDLDGKTWWDKNNNITIEIYSEVRGFGDIQSTLSDIEFAGDEYSISQNESRGIGSWGELVGTLPTSQEATWANEFHYWSESSPDEPGKYTWSSNGYTSLTPYKWKWKLSLREITGEWKEMGSQSESAKKVSGSWEVKNKFVCPVCEDEADTLKDLNKGNKHDKITCKRAGCNVTFRKCDVEKAKKHKLNTSCPATNDQGIGCSVTDFWGCEDPAHKHIFGSGSGNDDGSDNGGDGGGGGDTGGSEGDSPQQGDASPSNPTTPDRPGSFELSPRKTAILLRWTDSDSDGGSAITDYQYQIQYARTSNRTRWTSWSDWSSAGTGNSTWITGLYKGVTYAVRMRAVNAVGNSSVTGIKIVKTNK